MGSKEEQYTSKPTIDEKEITLENNTKVNEKKKIQNNIYTSNKNANINSNANVNTNIKTNSKNNNYNYDFLFKEGEPDHEDKAKELDKTEMMKKIQQKIKEIQEKESEIHKKFKNGYIPIGNTKTMDYLKSIYQNNPLHMENISVDINGPEPRIKMNPFFKTKDMKDMKEKENSTSSHNDNIELEDDEIGFMGRFTIKLDKFIKCSIQILNVLLGALFFVAAIFYFTGVHFDSFKPNYSENENGRGLFHFRKYRKPASLSTYSEFKGYSLLMTPDRTSETYKLLNHTITDLSREYNTELFEPHLTLYAPIDIPLKDLKKKLSSLTLIEPFQLQVTNVTTGNRYYQCVLGTVELTSDLQYVFQRTMQLLGLPMNQDYFPHISLIYGDFHTIMKKHILKEILHERHYKQLLPLNFTISQIEIWKTEGETKTWKCHDTIPFTPESDNEED